MPSFDNYPDTINLPVEMDHPNQLFVVHSGPFALQQSTELIGMHGEIFYQWIPNIGLRFSGKVVTSNYYKLDMQAKVELTVDSIAVGTINLKQVTHGEEIEIQGYFIGLVIWGDKSINVTSVTFGVTNLRNFFGDITKRIKDDSVFTSHTRLLFENEDFTIKLDEVDDYEEKHRTLSNAGGHMFLYAGTIESRDNVIRHDDLKKLVTSFSHFLTFLNGRRCHPFILTGVHDGEVKWTDYSTYTSYSYKDVVSWPCHMKIEGISALWSTWSEIAKDDLDFDFLTTAVHWYSEANSNAALVEGSIILAQTALELIYNWYVVEKKGIIVGSDASNISAANKIRLLLNQLNAPLAVPTSLHNLTLYNTTLPDQLDGPECFVRIRNAIVHANEDKRKTLAKISNMTRYDALNLSLWYIELALLKILDFKGQYANRCYSGGWAGEHEEQVPWNSIVSS